MAKLPVLLTVIFLLFTLSRANFTTEADETVTDLPEFDPESATAILLPSERPDFEPSKLLDFKHDFDANADAASVTESDSGIVSVPSKIGFHPVNRHFPRRPVVFPFRHHHNHRDCRFNKHSGHFNPRFHQKRFVYYGDDMIVSNEGLFDPESRGGVRQIQARWDGFNDDGSAESKHRVDFMKHHHHDHDHEHDLHHHHGRENKHHHVHDHHHGDDETEQHEGGGFMEKLRRLFIHV